MNIRFGGVTLLSGPRAKVLEYSVKERDENHAMRFGEPNGSMVLLTGQDIVAFYKKAFDVDYPVEMTNKGQAERQRLIESDPAKYNPSVIAVHRILADQAVPAAFEYAKACQAAGQDAEGNPVQVLNLGEAKGAGFWRWLFGVGGSN